MKFFKYILAVILILALSGCGNKKTSPGESIDSKQLKEATGMTGKEIKEAAAGVKLSKKYPVKSGIITFEKSGVIGKKKTVVYFDDYGVRERNESYNADGNIEEIRFSDGDKMYVINFKYSKDKIAYIMGPGHSGTEMKFVAEPFNSETDKQKYQYKKLGSMNIAGKTCEAYSTKTASGEVTFAGWNNILLYSKTKISMGEMVNKAVDIKENVSIDDSMFKVPMGYEIKNM